jgi:hypothetical protein
MEVQNKTASTADDFFMAFDAELIALDLFSAAQYFAFRSRVSKEVY